MMRFLRHLAFAVFPLFVGCQQPRGAERVPPTPEPLEAPTPRPACAELEIEVLPGQWPDPQWISLGEQALFGGGWSSISTGRFGSASWEHCETLMLIGDNLTPLSSQHPQFGELVVSERHDCRVPDGALGDQLFDFHVFSETMPEHDVDTARLKVGWAPASVFADTFYFESLDLWTPTGWQRHGFPEDGFHRGPSHVVIGPDLLMSGGYRELSGGDRRSVAQSALFERSTRQWVYTSQMQRPRRDHVLISVDDGAIAVGGIDEGGAVAPVERFDVATQSWKVLLDGPPVERSLAVRSETRGGGPVFVLELNDPDAALSRFARIDLDDENWTWLSPPQSVLLADFTANSLLPHPNGPVLVTPERVERYDTSRDLWQTCDVSRQLDVHPIVGKGKGTWGPAHLLRDGRVFLTRIDRERYYDFEE